MKKLKECFMNPKRSHKMKCIDVSGREINIGDIVVSAINDFETPYLTFGIIKGATDVHNDILNVMIFEKHHQFIRKDIYTFHESHLLKISIEQVDEDLVIPILNELDSMLTEKKNLTN